MHPLTILKLKVFGIHVATKLAKQFHVNTGKLRGNYLKYFRKIIVSEVGIVAVDAEFTRSNGVAGTSRTFVVPTICTTD